MNDISDIPVEIPLTDQRQRVEAVERSLLLLKCFQARGETLSLAMLAQRSGFYKSTILRLAASLEVMGFLVREPDGQFRLGPELRRLGALSKPPADLEAMVRPVLQGLSAVTQETASFYVRDRGERLCLYRVNSPRSTRHHLEEGVRHRLETGAAGKILRAYQAGATGSQATAIRRRGWEVSYGERDPDLAAIAVPLLDSRDHLLGALTVSGLKSRFTPELLALARGALLDAAADLRPRLSNVMGAPRA
jgi:DNA-binding IclR family transcriptional regulator